MSNKRNVPMMWFDNEATIELRIKVQKPWEREEFWAWYTIRRVSIYISRFISTKTNITPNALTLMGCFSAILASISFLVGTAPFIYIGFVLCQFGYLFDCIDGEVARQTGVSSRLGEWIDNGLRYLFLLIDISLMFSISYSFSHAVGFVVLYTSILSALISILTVEGVEAIAGENAAIDLSNSRKRNRTLDGVIFLFATSPGLYLGVFILTIFNSFYNVKLAIFTWVLFHFILYFIKSLYKLRLAYVRVAKYNKH